MARVYISALGAGKYHATTYCTPQNESDTISTRFIQEATVLLDCKNWSESDRILLLLTSKAREVNWNDNGETEGLRNVLNKLKLKPHIHDVDITSGGSKDDIWEAFDTIYNLLNEGDEVTVDITHGFRYLPLLMVVVLNYAKATKHISIRNIFYGNYEAQKDGCSPILDLSSFDHLLDWTGALDQFLTSGDASRASALAKRRTLLQSESVDSPDTPADSREAIAESMLEFTRAISTCRGPQLSEAAKHLKTNIAAGLRLDLSPPFQELLKLLDDRLVDFQGDTVHDGIAAAKWCLQHNLIQQGLTILTETLTCSIIERSGIPLDSFEQRQLASSAIHIGVCKLQNKPDKWRGDAKKQPEIMRQYLDNSSEWRAIAKILYGNLANVRNDIDHAGWRADPKAAQDFINDLTTYIESAEEALGIHRTQE